MFPTRMPLLLQLTMIVCFLKGCKLVLVLMPDPLQFSLHHNLLWFLLFIYRSTHCSFDQMNSMSLSHFASSEKIWANEEEF